MFFCNYGIYTLWYLPMAAVSRLTSSCTEKEIETVSSSKCHIFTM